MEYGAIRPRESKGEPQLSLCFLQVLFNLLKKLRKCTSMLRVKMSTSIHIEIMTVSVYCQSLISTSSDAS